MRTKRFAAIAPLIICAIGFVSPGAALAADSWTCSNSTGLCSQVCNQGGADDDYPCYNIVDDTYYGTTFQVSSYDGVAVSASDGAGGLPVVGQSNNNVGLYGIVALDGDYVAPSAAAGVYGNGQDSGYGIYGTSQHSDGVYGITSSTGSANGGVSGSGPQNEVIGVCTGSDCAGVAGSTGESNSTGIYGNGYGTGGYGVYGTGAEYGVYGTGTDYGVYGTSGVTGVEGSGSFYGVYGTSELYGVYGVTSGTGSGAYGVYGISGGGSSYAGYFTGNVYVNGSFGYSSDQRLKKNVEPLKNSIDQLLSLRGVTFEWKEPDIYGRKVGTQRGFIAQDVEKVFPEWVGVDKDGFKTIDVHQIEALEVESIRTLKTENDELRARMAKLEDHLSALENGRDPVTAGVGFGKGTLGLLGLGVAGAFLISRRKRPEQQS